MCLTWIGLRGIGVKRVGRKRRRRDGKQVLFGQYGIRFGDAARPAPFEFDAAGVG